MPVADAAAPEPRIRHNRAVAISQRRQVAMVQAYQPRRPVLVQPLREPEAQKKTRWVAVDAVPPVEELWTRSIGLNELVFDIDTKPFRDVRRAQEPLSEALAELGVPHVTAWTGGKGAHTHVFLGDIVVDEDVFRDAQRFEVDAWREARMVVANALLDAAGVPDVKAERWANRGGSGVFDRLKLSWSAKRLGSMVRTFGCAGGSGWRKTVAPLAPNEWPDKLPKGDDAPKLRFPKALPTWTVPRALQARIVDAIVDRIEKNREAKAAPEVESRAKGAKLADVPCLTTFMREGAEPGGRDYAFFHFIRRLYAMGVPEPAAMAYVRRALAAMGLPPTDKAVDKLRRIYAGEDALDVEPGCGTDALPGCGETRSCAFAPKSYHFRRTLH